MKLVIEVEKPEGCHAWSAVYVDGHSPDPSKNVGYCGVGQTPEIAIMALLKLDEIRELFNVN